MYRAGRQKLVLMKWLGLFSVIRLYNIVVIVLAMYLSSIYIFSSETKAIEIIKDPVLFLLVLSSSISIASGYIINAFYDAQKDLINRPNKAILDRMVSQKTKLYIYFSANATVMLLASLVSWRAVVFFAFYIFSIWFYSHKIKKRLFIGNLLASALAVFPFFAIFLYYKSFQAEVFAHAIYLVLIIFTREVTKDLENLKGDLTLNYQTFPVVFGEKVTKSILTLSVLLTFIPAYLLVYSFGVGRMKYFFMAAGLALLSYLLILWRTHTISSYKILHSVLKVIILLGVLSIILIDLKVVGIDSLL